MDDIDVPAGLLFVILVMMTCLLIITVYIIASSYILQDIKNILKSEGSGNFTDEDLEKIREIIVN